MKHSTLLIICFVVFFANAENTNDKEITGDKFSRIGNELMNLISRVQSVENEKNELRSEMKNLENSSEKRGFVLTIAKQIKICHIFEQQNFQFFHI